MINYVKPIIVSGPSGSGKDTLVKAIITKYSQFHDAIGYTTRPKRVNEIDGVDMNFVSKEVFEKMIENGDFIEYSEYVGNYYGMPISELNLAYKIPTIFNVGISAANKIKHYFDDAITILIIPPSKEELLKRLGNREIERFNIARKDIIFAKSFFEYIIISKNDMIDKEINDFENIVFGEKDSYKLKYFDNFIDKFFV